jgi:hypothetical protein
VITDDDSTIEIAQRQWLLQRIQAQTVGIPAAQREYIAHALLELAVSRLSQCRDAAMGSRRR